MKGLKRRSVSLWSGFLWGEVSDGHLSGCIITTMTDDKSPGIDNLDGKLLKMTAKYISKPLDWACAEIWKEAKVIPRLSQGYPKVIPLPKDKRKTFAGSNSRPISLLPVLSQIQYYFASNNLTRNYQPAYRDGHSTSTALAQMTDDWFRSTDDRRFVGAVMFPMWSITVCCSVLDGELPDEEKAASLFQWELLWK